jgi:hypothetical protein
VNLRIHRDPDSLPVPLGSRILARIHGCHLDHELAADTDPIGDPILAQRAAKLTAPASRHRLADGLRALVERADRPPQWSAAVPVARQAVLAERDHLLELAQPLDAPGPVGVRGVAAASVLLTDGRSPVWAPGDVASIADAVEAALIGIEVR